MFRLVRASSRSTTPLLSPRCACCAGPFILAPLFSSFSSLTCLDPPANHVSPFETNQVETDGSNSAVLVRLGFPKHFVFDFGEGYPTFTLYYDCHGHGVSGQNLAVTCSTPKNYVLCLDISFGCHRRFSLSAIFPPRSPRSVRFDHSMFYNSDSTSVSRLKHVPALALQQVCSGAPYFTCTCDDGWEGNCAQRSCPQVQQTSTPPASGRRKRTGKFRANVLQPVLPSRAQKNTQQMLRRRERTSQAPPPLPTTQLNCKQS